MNVPKMRFEYTKIDRDRIAAAVPLPRTDRDRALWASARSRSKDFGELTKAMPRWIAGQLQLAANNLIGHIAVDGRRPLREDLIIIERIAKSAKGLKHDLERANLAFPSFALLFELVHPSITLDALDEICKKTNLAEDMIRYTHRNDVLSRQHDPELDYFIESAIEIWEWWSGNRAGTGKTGSPAARFVCAAVNPLISFANKNKLGNLRGGNLIDENEAGRRIALHRKTIVKGKIGK